MKLHRTALSLAALAATAALVGPAFGSSHREAPAITEDPTADCTDVYAFVSPDKTDTVTLVANYIPLEEPSAGPNYFKFSDTALYEIHVDNDGDTKEDVTFSFRFTTTTKNENTFLYNTGPISVAAAGNGYDGLNVVQRYTVTRIDGDRRTGTRTVLGADLVVAPNNVGPKSIPGGYAPISSAATHALPSGIQVFCGPRDDPFFINLGRSFDLINIDPVLPGGQDAVQGATADSIAGFNCHTIAIQVPQSLLTANGATPTSAADPNSIIGIWSTSSRRQVQLRRTKGRTDLVDGAWVQVSRLGMPLVNELVIPRSNKDIFNNSEPQDDAQFLTFVQQPELAGTLVALFGANGLTVPAGNRDDMVAVFLTGVTGLNKKGAACEYLRLNMAIPLSATPNRLGVLAGQNDGFPNGRRLTDDVVDIALRVVHGVLVDAVAHPLELGDTVAENDVPFQTAFPYLANPHDGVTRKHRNE
ncbi:MAG: DUF4331 domain-containing protein [Planctomycetes bacterium]|nr:DUF4331 domain-containing protein [Planctomycetota bacterium]